MKDKRYYFMDSRLRGNDRFSVAQRWGIDIDLNKRKTALERAGEG
jgi:hypothetical protein